MVETRVVWRVRSIDRRDQSGRMAGGKGREGRMDVSQLNEGKKSISAPPPTPILFARFSQEKRKGKPTEPAEIQLHQSNTQRTGMKLHMLTSCLWPN